MYQNFVFIARVDGSWIKTQGRGGMGGVIKCKMGKTLFWVSGPAKGIYSIQIEWEAVKYMIETWRSSSFAAFHLLICSDSKILVSDHDKFLAQGNGNIYIQNLLDEGVLPLRNMEIQFIPRHYNEEADSLAKQGCKSGLLRSGWVGP